MINANLRFKHFNRGFFVFSFQVMPQQSKTIKFCKILFALTHVDSSMTKDQVHIKRSKHIKWLERIVHCVICVIIKCDMVITKLHLLVNNLINLPKLLRGSERVFGLIFKHARSVEPKNMQVVLPFRYANKYFPIHIAGRSKIYEASVLFDTHKVFQTIFMGIVHWATLGI